MRQIRAHGAVRRRSGDRVTRRAWTGEEYLFPFRGTGVRGVGGGGPRFRQPRGELSARVHDDVERHLRVLVATELRALGAIDPGLVSVQEQRRRVAGNEVALADDVRYPEAVDHIARRDLDLHRLARGDVHL